MSADFRHRRPFTNPPGPRATRSTHVSARCRLPPATSRAWDSTNLAARVWEAPSFGAGGIAQGKVRVERSAPSRSLNVISPDWSRSDRPVPDARFLSPSLRQSRARTETASRPGCERWRVGHAIAVDERVAMTARQDRATARASFEAIQMLTRSPRRSIRFLNQVIGCGGGPCRRHGCESAGRRRSRGMRRTSHLEAKRLPFGAPDLPLNRVLVKGMEDRVERRTQVQAVETEGTWAWLVLRRLELARQRPDLQILPPAAFHVLPQRAHHRLPLRPVREQRLAVIGERDGDETPSGQPTPDLAQDQAVADAGLRRRRV